VTTSINDATDGIDETPINAPTIHELVQPIQVIPTTHIVLFDAFHPIEHARYPTKLGELRAGANGLGIPAKVYLSVPGLPSLVRRPFTQIVVELAKIAYSGGLNHSWRTMDMSSSGEMINKWSNGRKQKITALLSTTYLFPTSNIPRYLFFHFYWQPVCYYRTRPPFDPGTHRTFWAGSTMERCIPFHNLKIGESVINHRSLVRW
jgi:hypothetical protein